MKSPRSGYGKHEKNNFDIIVYLVPTERYGNRFTTIFPLAVSSPNTVN